MNGLKLTAIYEKAEEDSYVVMSPNFRAQIRRASGKILDEFSDKKRFDFTGGLI